MSTWIGSKICLGSFSSTRTDANDNKFSLGNMPPNFEGVPIVNEMMHYVVGMLLLHSYVSVLVFIGEIRQTAQKEIDGCPQNALCRRTPHLFFF